MLPLNKVFFIDDETGFVTGGYSYDDDFMPIILKTEDGGNNWIELPGTEYLINDLFFENKLHGWAVGENSLKAGILIETTDGGENWTLHFESFLGALKAIHFSDNTGWAVEDNAQILKVSITDPVQDITDNDHLPGYLTLYQNRPNPFWSKTVISYYLSGTGDVELGVYDLLGRKISTLVNESQLPGRYEVEWDAANKEPGIYVCILESRGSKRIMKIILLR